MTESPMLLCLGMATHSSLPLPIGTLHIRVNQHFDFYSYFVIINTLINRYWILF